MYDLEEEFRRSCYDEEERRVAAERDEEERLERQREEEEEARRQEEERAAQEAAALSVHRERGKATEASRGTRRAETRPNTHTHTHTYTDEGTQPSSCPPPSHRPPPRDHTAPGARATAHPPDADTALYPDRAAVTAVSVPDRVGVTVRGLRPGAHVRVRVRAWNEVGASSWGDELQLEVPFAAPSAPRRLVLQASRCCACRVREGGEGGGSHERLHM